MSEKNTQSAGSGIELGEGISKAEGYLKDNKKSLSIILGAVLVVVLGYFGYTKFIVEPRNIEAEKQMFMAEFYFRTDSVEKALNGDGQFPGFLEIIDSYGSTKSANIACYNAGMCYMKKGDWNKAIEYLEKFDGEDDILGAVAYGAIGDANLELNKQEDALKYYRMAVDWDKNQFTAPLFLMKVGFVQEMKKDFKGATETYERIKKDYPKSTEARDIERYIVKAGNLAKAS